MCSFAPEKMYRLSSLLLSGWCSVYAKKRLGSVAFNISSKILGIRVKTIFCRLDTGDSEHLQCLNHYFLILLDYFSR